MKGLGYSRFGTQIQSALDQDYNPQKTAIEAYCLENGIELLCTFKDFGSSLVTQQEGCTELITFISARNNDIKFLIVSSIHRIIRNIEQVKALVSFLETNYNISLVIRDSHLCVDKLLGEVAL
ncbi:recombinase family protein [Mucilaginibacter flavidus]|uniref:recombinase family protein n=1 Tax=Mucilaginibacter flavidus TaxID=2949309 RepID=UPI0020928390|nr:recombinase family protein [Mucilaginibacter flavidus]MCO5948014.1 recombinase family protein [Mucilaginibacter flavidus]